MAKTISVVSLKGGCGKSFFSLNLASALAMSGKQALLIDLNFSSPSIHSFLGVSNPEATINHFLKGFQRAEDIVYQHPSGMKVIFGDADYGFTMLGSTGKIKDLVTRLSGKFDFIILDTAPSFSEGIKPAIFLSGSAIGVSQPYPYCLGPTLKSLELMKSQGTKALGLALNQCKKTASEIAGKSLPAYTPLPLLASITYDDSINNSASRGHPLAYLDKKSEISIIFSRLASTISSRILL